MPIHLNCRCQDAAVIFLFLLAVFAMSGASVIYAQSENKTSNGTVTINSNPAGAVIYLNGEYRFWGRTPFVLPYNLYGKYRLQANRRGYERITTIYNFTGESKGALTMRLTPKTQPKALYRSLLFPGWGQCYSERKLVGAIFMGATAGGFVALAVNQNQYQNAQNLYATAAASYNRSLSQGDISAQNAKFDQVQSALRSLRDAQNARNVTIYAIAGLWVFNALESVLFFPNFSDIEFFEKVSPRLSQEGSGVKLSLQFPID
jgi:hypothetical protein